MSTLHTINKSPYSNTSLASCLQVCTKYDAILLLEDGVFGASKGSPLAEQLQRLIADNIKVYAMINDVKARGIGEKLLDNIQLIDYENFVQLTIEHRCVQSWY